MPRPEQCEDDSKVIKELVTDILVKVRTPKPDDEDDEDTKAAWAEDSELDIEIKAKLLALRVLVNRMRAHTDNQSSDNASLLNSVADIISSKGF